jgi:hypothetical protein
MFSRLLKSNQPQVLVLVIFTGLGLWFPSFLNPKCMSIPSDLMSMPLYDSIRSIIPYNSNTSVIISFILVFVQALLLIQFNKKFIIINHRTYLPAFFFILITSTFVPLQGINPVIFGLLFIYIAIYFIFSIYRNDFALSILYAAGFSIAIASLFWAPFALFFIILIVSLVILRPFVGREWIVSILGFLSPFFFAYVFFFVFRDKGELGQVYFKFLQNFNVFKVFVLIHHSYYIFYGLVVLTISIASISVLKNFQKKKIRIRKLFTLNWWIFLVFLISFVVFRSVGYEVIFILAMPVSFLLTDYFYSVKNQKVLNVIISLLYVSSIYIQIIAHY